MLKTVHKYVRRVIVWLNTPSQEELDARARRDAERRAELLRQHQDTLRTSVLSAVQHRPFPGAYSAYCQPDLKFCASIIRQARDSGLCSESRAKEHLEAVARIGGARALEAA